MKTTELDKTLNTLLDEKHRLTLDLIELKRATACLYNIEYENLHYIDRELLKANYERLAKAVDALLDL